MNSHPALTALVPMKGKSERVPSKNMRLFNGKPLCRYVLETLQESPIVTRIIVNTDSADIMEQAQDFSKVVIHNRPEQLKGHHIPMNDILAWDLEQDAQHGCEHYLQTHATNPLLSCATIENAAKTYFENLAQYDALFSVTPLQTRLYTKDGMGVNHDPNILLNTQDLPVLYEENSNIYIFSKSSFISQGRRTGLRPYMFPMVKTEALDIDTEEDFKIAEAVWLATRS